MHTYIHTYIHTGRCTNDLGKLARVPKKYTVKTWGSGYIAPRILTLGIRRKLVVGIKLRPAYHQKELGGPQRRSARGGKEEVGLLAANKTPAAGWSLFSVSKAKQKHYVSTQFDGTRRVCD
jgi:hypothetical protein